jgi:hypothetical protein
MLSDFILFLFYLIFCIALESRWRHPIGLNDIPSYPNAKFTVTLNYAAEFTDAQSCFNQISHYKCRNKYGCMFSPDYIISDTIHPSRWDHAHNICMNISNSNYSTNCRISEKVYVRMDADFYRILEVIYIEFQLFS